MKFTNFFFVTVITTIAFGVDMNQPFSGHFTYYNDVGYGACGTQINANSEQLVAVSHELWDPSIGNPNNDPICNKCLKVEYSGKSITVPVKDKCPSCPRDHMDLSLPAFQALENPDKGNVYGATFTFVDC
uniref:RlpA-like protein double-psi beta-barrel domain-containing protein n=1 Tax=Panagrolaimus sp. PS1159 TaxID=55785 RepID=A0AC35FWA6_9BILA